MAKLQFETTDLPDVLSVRRTVHRDERGGLARLFCGEDFAAAGLGFEVSQSNLSWSATKGTMRGLHFQRAPHAEAKLVTCISGRIWDVAVDLRKGSATFGKWTACVLDAETLNALYIPPGFCHGFQTLTDNVAMVYFHSAAYAPEAEGGVDACDPSIGIPWPEDITVRSERDASLPPLKDLEPLA